MNHRDPRHLHNHEQRHWKGLILGRGPGTARGKPFHSRLSLQTRGQSVAGLAFRLENLDKVFGWLHLPPRSPSSLLEVTAQPEKEQSAFLRLINFRPVFETEDSPFYTEKRSPWEASRDPLVFPWMPEVASVLYFKSWGDRNPSTATPRAAGSVAVLPRAVSGFPDHC